MFKIREFSRFTRVSVKMLRHYDRLGLLSPARIDQRNRYRFYSADQLPRLNRIIALKDMGFSLREIGEMLDSKVADADIRDMFLRRRDEVKRSMQEDGRRLRELEARLAALDSSPKDPPHSVVLRSVAAQWIAGIRATVPVEYDLAPLFGEAELHAAHHHGRAAASPLAIFHDEEFPEGGGDVEVAIPLNAPIPAGGRVRVRELPAEPAMACVVFAGSYAGSPHALSTLLVWMQNQGFQAGGALREVYHRFDARELDFLGLPESFLADREDQFVTELQIPVEPRPARERS